MPPASWETAPAGLALRRLRLSAQLLCECKGGCQNPPGILRQVKTTQVACIPGSPLQLGPLQSFRRMPRTARGDQVPFAAAARIGLPVPRMHQPPSSRGAWALAGLPAWRALLVPSQAGNPAWQSLLQAHLPGRLPPTPTLHTTAFLITNHNLFICLLAHHPASHGPKINPES